MTAVATPAPAPTRHVARGHALTGIGALIRLNLRRDRLRMLAWLAGISLLQATAPSTYQGIYPEEADRLRQAAIMDSSPAMKAMTGPGHGLDHYTYGAMISNEYLGFTAIFAALMSVFMVVRHTRAEEEAGRAELVRASVVGRHAHLTAALATMVLANIALGLLIAVGMGAAGVPSVDWTGSFVFGAGLAAVGVVFGSAAAVTAQVTGHSRAASGVAGALIGIGYAVRAIGDVADNGLSWLSPMGWAQAAAPYVNDDWRPLGLAAAVAAALAAAAYALSVRRDIGAGLRSERAGAATGSAWLGTPLGFAWRLQRASAIWWAVAMFGFGMAYGSAVDVIDSYSDNEVVLEITKSIGGDTLVESWLSMVISLLAIVCTIFAVIAVLRPRREETSGRAETALATAVSRVRWAGAHVALALIGGAALLLVTGAGLGLGAALTSGEGHYVGDVLAAAVAYTPALWLTAGLAAAVFGVAPRAIALAWALVAYAILIVYLGGLLNLPGWMLNLSPYTHIPRMPADEFTGTPLVVLTGIAAALVAVGLLGFRRRDVDAS